MVGERGEGRSVLAAMSGGVDSSVAALLLVEQGFAVTGVTMKLFDEAVLPPGAESGCCSIDDVEDARAACRRLGIRHLTLNFKERFACDVIDRFCAAYLSGRTPNPCIDCNRYLKFAGLQQRRRELGAAFVATGHYARRERDERTGLWKLLRAADPRKDQSYVLYHLTQDDLAHMLFPLGGLTKAEVRAVAQRAGFTNAQKRESQDICFVPDGDYASFIERYQEGVAALFEPGDIVDATGTRLGRHAGLVRYTVGQRRGIGIASAQPLYVLAKDASRNQLVVGPREQLAVREVRVGEVNIIAGTAPAGTLAVQAKTAYRQQSAPAELHLPGDGTALIRFAEPQTAPAPGQAAVCYSGDEVICGGTVESTSA